MLLATLGFSAVVEAQPVVAVPGYTVELVASGARAADGLIVGADGYIYVADYGGASNGALLRVLSNTTNGVFETIAGPLNNPTDVARTPGGRLFVTESANGNLTEVFLDGTTSVLAGGFPTATSIEYTASGLLTTNSSPGTITITDLTGSTQTILSGITFPYGATVAASGTLFFIEFGSGTLFESDLTGSTPSVIGNASAFGAQFTALDPEGTMFISDPLANVIWRLDAPGQLSVFASGFTGKANLPVIGPTGIGFDETGILFVSDGLHLWRIAPSNRPPTAAAGSDQTVECTGPNGTPVTLDGTGSTDPNDDALTFTWTGGNGPIQGPTPTPILTLGTYEFTLSVDDGNGGADTDTVLVTVQDTTPPDLTLSTTSIEVSPTTPTGTPVDVEAASGVVADDLCDPNPSLTHDAPDKFPIGVTTDVTFTATDASGSTSTAVFSVTVLTLAEATQAIIDLVQSYGLPPKVARGLRDKLDDVLVVLSDSNQRNDGSARNILRSFIRKVATEQRKGNLTAQQAGELTAAAQDLLAALG